jgi:hypothetical protein
VRSPMSGVPISVFLQVRVCQGHMSKRPPRPAAAVVEIDSDDDEAWKALQNTKKRQKANTDNRQKEEGKSSAVSTVANRACSSSSSRPTSSGAYFKVPGTPLSLVQSMLDATSVASSRAVCMGLNIIPNWNQERSIERCIRLASGISIVADTFVCAVSQDELDQCNFISMKLRYGEDVRNKKFCILQYVHLGKRMAFGKLVEWMSEMLPSDIKVVQLETCIGIRREENYQNLLYALRLLEIPYIKTDVFQLPSPFLLRRSTLVFVRYEPV